MLTKLRLRRLNSLRSRSNDYTHGRIIGSGITEINQRKCRNRADIQIRKTTFESSEPFVIYFGGTSAPFGFRKENSRLGLQHLDLRFKDLYTGVELALSEFSIRITAATWCHFVYIAPGDRGRPLVHSQFGM